MAENTPDEVESELRKDCPYCSLKASDQKVVSRNDLVWFVQDDRYQGSLKHSGVIIPVAHRETVFDLTSRQTP